MMPATDIRNPPAARQRDHGLVVAVDTREKMPYEFAVSKVKTLKTGDYSIVGQEDQVAIERKTLADAYSSLGRQRRRFRLEVERMQELTYAAIVIEADLRSFLEPAVFSRVNPRAALGSLLAWAVAYGIGIFFAGDRKHGNDITLRLLEQFWLKQLGGKRD